MKNLKPISLIGMILLLIAGACENLPEVEISSDAPNLKTTESALKCEPVCDYKLFAGQNMLVGQVLVRRGYDYICVEYHVDDCWCITETHLHVAESLEGIPQTRRGNPIPGQFDFKGEHDCVNYVYYHVPVPAGSTGDLYIATHAVVTNDCTGKTETAWASFCGTCCDFPGNNWATYFTYTLP
jgi:hypothetical protein